MQVGQVDRFDCFIMDLQTFYDSPNVLSFQHLMSIAGLYNNPVEFYHVSYTHELPNKQ